MPGAWLTHAVKFITKLTWLTFILCFPLLAEEHDSEAPGVQRRWGWAPAQEKACEGPQRPEPGALQEQSPLPPAFRPGEQPPSGTLTRQEEEEAPEQETLNGEWCFTWLLHGGWR